MGNKKKTIVNQYQLELLKKYFPIDEENKIVTLKIYYDKATDMLDFSVGELHHEMLNNEILEKITSITDRIPNEYKVNIIFIIDKYCDYKPEMLIEKLNDLIEINNYQIISDKKKNCVIAAILIITGFILLSLLSIGKNLNWFGQSNAGIFEEILDITSWVFVWQAVTVLFLSPSHLAEMGVKFISRVNEIAFGNKNEEILVKENSLDVINRWHLESKISRFKKICLLISSTFLITKSAYLGLYYTIVFIDDITDPTYIAYSGFTAIFIALEVITILTGVFGISIYNGKNKYKKACLILAPIVLLLFTVELVLLIRMNSYSDIVTTSVSIIAALLFTVSVYFSKDKHIKKN